ncbi:MAG: ABC transporter ATP-binding protein [Desulfosalsimonadaceae bacterium]
MNQHKDIFAEKDIGKSADFKLIGKLAPFASPYRLIMLLSLLLIVAATVFELAAPYITKEAIDRYIVPVQTDAPTPSMGLPNAGPGKDGVRQLSFSLEENHVKEVANRYPRLFAVDYPEARISYEDLQTLPSEEIARLRQSDMKGVGLAALLLLVVVFLNFLTTFAQVRLMEYAAQKIMHDIRLKLFAHIQGLSIHFFNKNPVGRLVTRVTNDIANMHEMLTSVVIFVIKDLFIIIGITVVLFIIDWKLAIAVYALFPAVFYAAWRFAGTAREAYRTLRIKIAEINSRFSETIGGVHILQLFNQLNNNYQAFRKINREYYRAGMRQVTVFALFMPVIEMMSSVALAVVIFYGGARIIGGRISLGELVVFISYVRMFFRPIRDIAEKYNITQNALSSAERILLILDEKDRLPEPEPGDALPVPRRITSLCMEDVWFSYIPGEPVLKDVSFEMNAGSTLAVVGPTGAGKTSLISLLVRFYDPDDGTIRINDTDIRRFNSSEMRARMAIVAQDPFLFSGSIQSNIFPPGTNASNVDDEQIERILEQAQCKKIIDRLPDGLTTNLNERGDMLSSGQRQLISIARALAADPEIIIFDEATSYVDSETEASIQTALLNLMAERTAIIIAHRLSTAKIADCILVMHNGKIIESGTHDELMQKGGFYYRLVNAEA